MLLKAIASQSQTIASSESEMHNERRELNEVKTTLGLLRAKIARANESCGLLEQPQLLRDYDRMVLQFDEYGTKIGTLKSSNNILKWKLFNTKVPGHS